MRRIITYVLIAVMAITALSSCATTLPERFDMFANTVEKRADNYSLKTWERKNERFKNLCNEYKDNFKKYSMSDRRKIHNAMATYVMSATKSGVITVTDTVSEITEQITNLVSEAKEFFQSLGIGKGNKK